MLYRIHIQKGDHVYRKILVPLDGSGRAEVILPHVEELAHRCEADVIFLQVIEPTPVQVVPDGYVSDVRVDVASQESTINVAQSYLDGLRGEFRQKGIQVKSFVEQGPVVKTIINVAEREGVELIAMASHGRSGLSRVFYGSVAAGVLNRVARPLLLIRAEGVE
jgi:nucleotide-binding universal stress UspA family protein